MPRKYSEDLRWRAVWQHCLQGKPVGAVARDLYISDSSVERYVKLFTTTGEVMPSTSTQHRPGPKRKLSEFEEITVLQSLLDRPGTYLRHYWDLKCFFPCISSFICLSLLCAYLPFFVRCCSWLSVHLQGKPVVGLYLIPLEGKKMGRKLG